MPKPNQVSLQKRPLRPKALIIGIWLLVPVVVVLTFAFAFRDTEPRALGELLFRVALVFGGAGALAGFIAGYRAGATVAGVLPYRAGATIVGALSDGHLLQSQNSAGPMAAAPVMGTPPLAANDSSKD